LKKTGGLEKRNRRTGKVVVAVIGKREKRKERKEKRSRWKRR
jgi:hypothetical protein